jgi:hypothetical protein
VAKELGASEITVTTESKELIIVANERSFTFKELQSLILDIAKPIIAGVVHLNLRAMNQVVAAVEQGALVDWRRVGEMTGQSGSLTMPLANLLAVDGMKLDREFGVCPIPVFEFSDDDWEALAAGTSTNVVKDRLVELGIRQFFFPPADTTALGLADRGIRAPDRLRAAVALSPQIGLPYGQLEHVPGIAPLEELLDVLLERNLLVETEIGLEPSVEGFAIRASVRARPREGAISKILQRFNISLNVSPKDFMGGSG